MQLSFNKNEALTRACIKNLNLIWVDNFGVTFNVSRSSNKDLHEPKIQQSNQIKLIPGKHGTLKNYFYCTKSIVEQSFFFAELI